MRSPSTIHGVASLPESLMGLVEATLKNPLQRCIKSSGDAPLASRKGTSLPSCPLDITRTGVTMKALSKETP